MVCNGMPDFGEFCFQLPHGVVRHVDPVNWGPGYPEVPVPVGPSEGDQPSGQFELPPPDLIHLVSRVVKPKEEGYWLHSRCKAFLALARALNIKDLVALMVSPRDWASSLR